MATPVGAARPSSKGASEFGVGVRWANSWCWTGGAAGAAAIGTGRGWALSRCCCPLARWRLEDRSRRGSWVNGPPSLASGRENETEEGRVRVRD